MTRVLYVSQTGMTEPLGQSQVVAYLERLAAKGVDYDLVSMEPAGTQPARVEEVRDRLDRSGICWHPLERASTQRLSRKAFEAARLGFRTVAYAARRRPDIVHARAHFPGAIADAVASITPGSRFLFDCRGLLGDQYVDVGHWTEQRLEYRMLKAWERRAFRRADGLVVLTKALERWLDDEGLLRPETPRAVIPCCVDTRRFVPDDDARRAVRADLGVAERTLVAYSGGLGAWYLEDEMAAFLGHLRRHRSDVALLAMTRTPTERFRRLLGERGFGERDVFFRTIPPENMHRMIAAADVGLSLIKPSFSVIGTSPTKLAEYLSCGLIGVANEGVGDLAELAAEPDACVIAPRLDEASLAVAAERTARLLDSERSRRVQAARAVAEVRFSLDGIGVARYEALYRAMLAPR
jgi:glycosyltransferase involved in cell wall biosynthesis